MSKIKTFKGKLAMGVQKRLHLATSDGLTGYRIHKLKIIPETPGAGAAVDHIFKVFISDQTGSISATVDFNNTDLLAVARYQQNTPGGAGFLFEQDVIFDRETVNQDIYIYFTDADGGTHEGNYYLELEQFKLNINESTFATLKNIRSAQQ